MNAADPPPDDLAATLGGAVRVGVLINPHSGRNRAGIEEERRLMESNRDLVVRRTDDARGARMALAELARAGVNLLVVHGGDGTLQRVFHLLYNGSLFDRPPALAVLPGGTTNMIANDIGAARRPAEELGLLIRRLRSGDWRGAARGRWLIAARAGDAKIAQYGLFAGAAGIYQGTTLARRPG